MSDEQPPREAPMSTTATVTAKEEVMEMLQRLPDEITLDEIQHSIFVLQKAKLARQALADGDVYTHEEVKERLRQWLTDD
jgi:predicted transcriptional regulator